jgi:hypothetical protein
MPQVGFEPTISVFDRRKAVHALDRAVTVIGRIIYGESQSISDDCHKATIVIVNTAAKVLGVIHSFINGSTALRWALVAIFFSFVILYTVGRTPWTGISSSQGRYLHTGQYKHRINAHKHPCLEWDPNTWPQRSSGRRRCPVQYPS